MRLQDLNEANLAATELPARKYTSVNNPKSGQPLTRPELFLYKVMSGSAFTLVKGGEIVIDPAESRRVADWIRTGPSGVIKMKTMDPDLPEVSNTQLLKTDEFLTKSAEKERIAVKPSDVFPSQEIDVEALASDMAALEAAGGFSANQMYNKLAGNADLKKLGGVGEAIISMAKQITQGQVPVIPKGLSDSEIKAIELYAGEYLGVLQVVYGTASFDKREQFLKWVGSDLTGLMLFFPKASNNPIADSYTFLNRSTGNALAISSKAAGKGAPPSLSSLKVPDLVKKKYPEAYEFIRTAQTQGTGITQAFYLMNWLYNYDSSLIPTAWQKFLPWSDSDMQAVTGSIKGKGKIPAALLKAAKSQLSNQVAEGSAPDGGKVFYAVITDLMKAVNAGAVPNFREAILTSLGFNFVQIYSNVRGGRLESKAFWPAKVDGQVKLKSKSSAQEDKGKISYQVSD